MTFDFGGVSVAVGSVAAAQEVVVFAAAVHLRHHALLDVVEADDSGLGLEGVGAMFRPCLFLFFVLLLNEIMFMFMIMLLVVVGVVVVLPVVFQVASSRACLQATPIVMA